MSSSRHKNSMGYIASLRFEIPASESGAAFGSQSRGTVDFDEVNADAGVVEEVISLSDGETFRIGRERTNDLVLQNSNVSRHHAVFSASRSGLVLSDLSSLNGTLLNGRRVSHPVNLTSDDVVRIGQCNISIDLHLGDSSDEEFSMMQTQSTGMRAVMVTVLIADVGGYTRLSQEIPPDQVARMLDLWFRKSSEVISRNGGEIDKYIGDCVMALWKSSGGDVGEGARRAMQAAQEILSETELLAAGPDWQYQESHPWRCRVVLNTGDALMGTIGGAGAHDFTVLGNTINAAFRIEGIDTLKPHALIVSESTACHLKELHSLESLGPVIIEGQTDTVEVFTPT